MKKQSAAKGFAILSIANIMTKFMSLAYLPLITMALGQDGYGVYSKVYAIYTLIYVIANSGLPSGVAKLTSELFSHKRYGSMLKAFKISRSFMLILGIIVSILMAISSPLIAKFYGNNTIILGLIALSPTILITTMLSAYRGYFQGQSNLTPFAVTNIFEQLINVIFSVLFAYILVNISMDWGVVGGTIGTTLGALVALLYTFFYYHKTKNVYTEDPPDSKYKISGNEVTRKLIKYSIPITISTALLNIGILIDGKIFEVCLSNIGYEKSLIESSFGILNKYNQIINVPLVIITSLAAAVLPALVSNVSTGNIVRVQRGINYSLKTCFLISIPSAIGIMVLSNPIGDVLKVQSSDPGKLFLFGGFVVIFQSIANLQITILQSINRLNNVIVSMTIGIIVKIIVSFIFTSIPSVNILGSIIGNASCYIVVMVINNKVIGKYLGFKLKMFNFVFNPLLCGMVMGLFVFLTNKVLHMFMGARYIENLLIVLIGMLVGGLTYGLSLVYLNGISKSDIDAISPRLFKKLPNFLRLRLNK